MIEVKNLTKKFGKFTALDDLNLSFTNSKSIALIGPNGCGKTTLIKSILGLNVIETGDILVDGELTNTLKISVFENNRDMRMPDQADLGVKRREIFFSGSSVHDVFPDRIARAAVRERNAFFDAGHVQHFQKLARFLGQHAFLDPDRRAGFMIKGSQVDETHHRSVVIAKNAG